MIPIVEKAVNNLSAAGVKPYKIFVYTLVQDVEEAHERIMAIHKMGAQPFAQPYRDFNGGEPTVEQRRLARWCNHKAAFKSCTWEEYKRSFKS